MGKSVRTRLDSLLRTICNFVNAVFVLMVSVLVLVALGLITVAYHVYKPTIILIIVVCTCAIFYLNYRRDAVLTVFQALQKHGTDDTNTSTGLSSKKREEGDAQVTTSQRAATMATDFSTQLMEVALTSVQDWGNIIAAGLAVTGAIMCVLRLMVVGIILIALGVLVFAFMGVFMFCIQAVVSAVVGRCVSMVFGSEVLVDESTSLVDASS